jgi:6-phosphofructokinase
VDILFTIGGDGTLAGADEIAREGAYAHPRATSTFLKHVVVRAAVLTRKLAISVIGVPKTIDNGTPQSECTRLHR